MKQHSHCNLCNLWFPDEKIYSEHLIRHPQCKYCKKVFGRLEREILKHHVYRSHYCLLCDRYFYPLEEHLKKDHPYSEKIKAGFLNEKIHSKFKDDCLKLLRCKVCEKQLYSIEGLDSHTQVKHDTHCKVNLNSSLLEYLGMTKI